MSGDSRPRRMRFNLRDESGQVLAFVVGALATLLVMSAFVIDVGHAFWAKRKLQSSADAAALAGAYDLPDTAAAMAAAREYSGTVGKRNHEIPGTQTDVCITGYPDTATCSAQPNKVIVVERGSVNTFFGGLIGIGSYNISARAVASRGSTTVGTPLAVYVHELCGASSGNKGLIVNGENATIEGGIHVNGHLEIGGINFVAAKTATVYRPPNQGTSPPTAGKTHSETCKTTDKPDSRYCTTCSSGPTDAPSHGPYRDWRTLYHTRAIMEGYTPCTIFHTGDKKYQDEPIPNGVHCLPNDKKFTIAGNSSGNITVIGGFMEVGGSGVLRPYNTNHPVLFYSTVAGSAGIKMNPSGPYDWNGYIINRFGGIEINANGVTSPFNGLLEAEWILVNGANFRMLGTFPDVTEGGQMGGLTLDE